MIFTVTAATSGGRWLHVRADHGDIMLTLDVLNTPASRKRYAVGNKWSFKPVPRKRRKA